MTSGQATTPDAEPTGVDRDPDALLRLRRNLDALVPLSVSSEFIRNQDRSGRLSTLLQLLLEYPGPKALAGIGDNLTRSLGGELTEREQQVLAEGARSLLKCEIVLIDRSLPLILSALRTSPVQCLATFLLSTCNPSSTDNLEAIWPHVVNEFLLGAEFDQHATEQLMSCIDRLRGASLERASHRLAELEAVRTNRIANDVFFPPRRELYGAFGELLKLSETSPLGPRLLRGFQAHPPFWPGAVALATFHRFGPTSRGFLMHLLRERAVDKASSSLQQLAGRIILGTIEKLPEGLRRQAWVPEAIETLGLIRFVPAVETLKKVAKEKRHLVNYVWPTNCRKAATVALEDLAQGPPIEE